MGSQGLYFNPNSTVSTVSVLTAGRVTASPGQSLKIDVAGLRYDIGGNRGVFAGALAQSVTDDTVSRVYLDATGTLQIKTTAQQADFPAAPHIPFARVVAANGEIENIFTETLSIGSASSAAVGTCRIKFPVDGGVKGASGGGSCTASSNNSVASVTFSADGESHNRWNMGTPGNYISGNLTFRVKCSVAGTGGTNGVRIGLNWTGISSGTVLPSSYANNVEQTHSLSGIANDELFDIDLIIAEANFDATKEMYAIELYRNGDHAEDTTGLTLHTHLCELRYTGYTVAGQAGQ